MSLKPSRHHTVWHARSLGITLLTGLAALLTACGGGGGGGGGTPGPVDGARFTAAYVPLASGDRRLYANVSDGQPQPNSSEVVGDTVVSSGTTAHRVRDEAGEISLLARTATGILLLPSPSGGDLFDGFGPVEVLRFGLAAGESVQLLDRSISTDVDGDGRADTLRLRLQSTLRGFETVQVPAGRFEAAARVRTDAITDVSFATGQRLGVQIESDEWYAQGVGLVRSSVRTRTEGQEDSLETTELLAYGVGGQRSDTVAPRIVEAGTADGARTGAQPQLSLRFSKPLDTWGLTGQDGATTGLHLVNAQGTLVPLTAMPLVDADGQGARLVLPGPLAEGEYRLRLGSAALDWAGNAVQGGEIRFTVDTTAPRLASSTPAAGDASAAVQGALSLVFDEPVRPAPGSELFIEVSRLFSLDPPQRLPAAVAGTSVSATLGTALRHNSNYELRLVGTLADEAGNSLPGFSLALTFRTDPGPLARPQPLAEGLRAWSVRRGDIDGDGREDLVFVANTVSPAAPRSVLAMRPGQSAGGFGAVRTLTTLNEGFGCEGREAALGDFDGNGRLDVAITCGSFVQVMLQNLDGSFRMERPGINGGQGLGALDLDADGRVDLLLLGTGPGQDVGTQQGWQAMRRETDGRWTALPMPAMGGDFAFPFGAALADVDGDGRTDIVWARRFFEEQRLELAWALRQPVGFGPVNSRVVTSNSGFGYALTAGDVNGDGRVDVLLTMQGSESATLWQLSGEAGGFGNPQSTPLTGGPSIFGLALADLDGDGRSDVLLQRDPQGTVEVLLQSQAGSWDAERSFELSATGVDSGLSMMVLDVNGDGLRDLLVRGDVLLGRPWQGAWPASATAGPRTRLQAAPAAGHGLGSIKDRFGRPSAWHALPPPGARSAAQR